jgi:hypothetical protein
MNERIDKLLVKAGAYFGGEGVDYSNFDPKKFAELIVQECAESASYYGNRVRQHVLKHFGVEE